MIWAMGSLVVRALDSRPEGLGSMPDAIKYPPSTHEARASLNHWVRKSCGLNLECRGLENVSLPFSSMTKLRRGRSVASPSTVPLRITTS
ncbi:hypothetical protein TNCV_98901 [Trichonephila clavipes]|nr:hypothetical protein TNCV_98901 [Trichonephila clavipes]